MFCSRECSLQAARGERTYSKEEVIFTCEHCGESFTRLRSWVENSTGDAGSYCSVGCKNIDQTSGRGNGQWIDGESGGRSYGPNWSEQREKALERDFYQCRVCRIPNREHKRKYNTGLNVHHQTPRRYFDDDRKANRLRNLITLCCRCHGITESQWVP